MVGGSYKPKYTSYFNVSPELSSLPFQYKVAFTGTSFARSGGLGFFAGFGG
jgi:hypothetical protein